MFLSGTNKCLRYKLSVFSIVLPLEILTNIVFIVKWPDKFARLSKSQIILITLYHFNNRKSLLLSIIWFEFVESMTCASVSSLKKSLSLVISYLSLRSHFLPLHLLVNSLVTMMTSRNDAALCFQIHPLLHTVTITRRFLWRYPFVLFFVIISPWKMQENYISSCDEIKSSLTTQRRLSFKPCFFLIIQRYYWS